jgi:hypothetical protein
LLNAGFQAPMIEGFQRFILSPKISNIISKAYEEQLKNEKANPYDTHPALTERVAALRGLPARPEVESEPAHVLLSNARNIESQLLKAIAVDKEKIAKLREVDWDEIVETVYLPQWEKSAKTYYSVLKGFTASRLPERTDNLELFARIARIGKMLPANVKPEQVEVNSRAQVVDNVIGAALAVALHREGWQIVSGLGENFQAIKGERQVELFTVYYRLLSGELPREQWKQTCEQAGIAELPLVS